MKTLFVFFSSFVLFPVVLVAQSTRTIYSTPSLDGWTTGRKTGYTPCSSYVAQVNTLSSLRVGYWGIEWQYDLSWLNFYHSYISFDIGDLIGKQVLSAALTVYQSGVTGQPYSTGGSVVLDLVDYGSSLITSTHCTQSLAADLGTISTDATLGSKTLDVTSAINFLLSKSKTRGQFRFRYEKEASVTAGYATFESGESQTAAPKLVLILAEAAPQSTVLLGLGAGGGGWIGVRTGGTGLSQIKWVQVAWPEYAARVGETRPVAGDVDGDGKKEIIIGLGPGSDGHMEIIGDVSTGYAHKAWIQIGWNAYNSENGETRPAVADIDGDGKMEIVVGLGSGAQGWIEVFGDASIGYAHKAWLQLPWDEYNAKNGAITPFAVSP